MEKFSANCSNHLKLQKPLERGLPLEYYVHRVQCLLNPRFLRVSPRAPVGAVNSLKFIDRRANVLDVQSVLGYISRIQAIETRKEVLAGHLAKYYKWKGIAFTKPMYKTFQTA